MLKRVPLLPTIFLALATLWLRLRHLGYSDYQGDEIKALFRIAEGQSVSEFLLTQRKGPVQFIVTYLLQIFDPSYESRLFIRLPFAIAGILAVLFFYKLLKDNFSQKVAFFGAFFMATNGFLIAFGRIVQYQSFVILFMILALFMFSLSVKKEKWRVKGIYFGFIFWAISILSHYDGVFIAPFAAYFLFNWVKSYVLPVETRFTYLKHLFLALIISGVMLASFYIPFLLHISDATKSYWQGRLEGTGGKISSSKVLFQAYQPIYVIHIYTLLVLFGGLVTFKELIKPTISSTIKSDRLKLLALLAWFAIPFVFFEVLVDIPGTHIYAYLIPVFVIMGLAIVAAEDIVSYVALKLSAIVQKASIVLTRLGIFVVFAFIFLQSHAIFVNHTYEYPWEPEPFMIWEFHQPSPIFHLSMFGFPYYRHWNSISTYVTTTENNGYYSTNERSSISRYHVPFKKDTDSSGHLIHIINPQSFTPNPIQDKAKYWAENNEPDKTFYSYNPKDPENERPIVNIYYMPQGSLDELMLVEDTTADE